MKIIELDITGCKYLDEVHEKIRRAFNFPEWYGKNWDALFDLLRSECDADKVIIKGEKTLPDDFAPQIDIMHKTFELAIRFANESGLKEFTYEVID